MKFSIIIPVYNRPDEIDDLLRSLADQSVKNFEVVITEDGSTMPCEEIVEKYSGVIPIKYFFKSNEGRSIARNNSMTQSDGDYFVFFDSDCVIPTTYFETLERMLAMRPCDCFGGPDAAHSSFTDTQKAINFAMTSFLTTGGIRGGKVQMEKFTPRTFNMGFSREVYEKVGGFREMFSEDIDMSKRVEAAGFTTALIRECPVYHKRRVDFKKFFRQVYVFGMSRITLKLLYPGSLKIVHALPACFVVGLLALISLGIFVSFSREVYEKVGGFREMFSEDIDMSKRVEAAGFTTALIRECPVYHKRRVDFKKFFRQVYVFGMSRITLKLLYPGSLKIVHALPACFVVGLLALISLGIFVSPGFFFPLGIYALALFVSALASTRSVPVALKAVPASFIQLLGYGCGFLKAFFLKIVLRRGRDVSEEILIRKGK